MEPIEIFQIRQLIETFESIPSESIFKIKDSVSKNIYPGQEQIARALTQL